MKLLVFLLACHGLVQIVTGGKIFARVRAFVGRISGVADYWIRCPMCLGVPVGVGWAAAGLWPRQWPTGGWHFFLDMLAAGMTSSAFCWAAHVVQHRLGEDEL